MSSSSSSSFHFISFHSQLTQGSRTLVPPCRQSTLRVSFSGGQGVGIEARGKEAGALVAGALWLFACYGSRASALSIWWLLPQFLKNLKKLPFFYSKRAPSPSKTEVLHEKNVIFYSKKAPSLAKNEVSHEKNVFFYSKRPPSCSKN